MEMIESWSALIWSSLKVLLYCSVQGSVWIDTIPPGHRTLFELTWMYAGLVEDFVCDPVANAYHSMLVSGWQHVQAKRRT
jgi:hypothetical protein